MSQTQFYIRWKGRQTGPHTLAEIQEKLDTGEFGLMHEVLQDSRWIPLSRFLENPPAPPPVIEPKATPQAEPPKEPAPAPAQQREEERETAEMEPEEDSAEESESPDAVDQLLLTIGYATCILALFLFPQFTGFGALMLGTINLIRRHYIQGPLQIALALVCGYVGMNHTALWGKP